MGAPGGAGGGDTRRDEPQPAITEVKNTPSNSKVMIRFFIASCLII